LNSTLYHQFLRYHDIIYSFDLRSGASAWRVDGHVEVNHTYSASLTPSVYTFPLWHPQYTSDKSVSGAVASYSFGWHSAYPYTFPRGTEYTSLRALQAGSHPSALTAASTASTSSSRSTTLRERSGWGSSSISTLFLLKRRLGERIAERVCASCSSSSLSVTNCYGGDLFGS
jgi:hypothetical protein